MVTSDNELIVMMPIDTSISTGVPARQESKHEIQ